MPLLFSKKRDPTEGFVRKRKVLKRLLKPQEMPELAEKYAESMSEFTGVEEEKVKQSKPFKNYLEKLRR